MNRRTFLKQFVIVSTGLVVPALPEIYIPEKSYHFFGDIRSKETPSMWPETCNPMGDISKLLKYSFRTMSYPILPTTGIFISNVTV